MEGMISLYYSFLMDYLPGQSKKIALLQLTGRIEDYLVKEFFWYAYKKSNFCFGNVDGKGQQKVDICLLKQSNDKPIIFSMIEVKYFRNIHRIWLETDATDEIMTSLSSLKRQLHICKHLEHGTMKVELRAKTKSIYGLVFGSFVSAKKNDPDKQKFFSKILNYAKKDFRYHDLPKPYFRPIFDDVKLKVFDETYCVTLKGGLWKRKGAII